MPEKKFALRLFTIGSLITPEFAKKIVDLCPLFTEITMYGIFPAVRDSVTRLPGSFKQTVTAIELLAKYKIRLLIKTPVMLINISEVAAVKAYALALDAQFKSDAVISPKLGCSKQPLDYRFEDDALAWLFSEITNGWSIHAPEPDTPVCNAGKTLLAYRRMAMFIPVCESNAKPAMSVLISPGIFGTDRQSSAIFVI